MDYQQREVFRAKLHKFSRQTVLFGALFIITLVVAVFVGLDGVLEYFKLVTGSPLTTLEMGAIIFSACVAPFLAMGMSITADMDRNKQGANEAR
jgi:membrane-bound ClpP family serine protease